MFNLAIIEDSGLSGIMTTMPDGSLIVDFTKGEINYDYNG